MKTPREGSFLLRFLHMAQAIDTRHLPPEREESKLAQTLMAIGLIVGIGVILGALVLVLIPERHEPAADCIGFSRVVRKGATIEHTCYGLIVPEASEEPLLD